MQLLSFEAQNYRNLRAAAFRPCAGVNVIFGENGQGKTNLIEGIWLFTGCRSFRTADNRELVTQGEKEALLAAAFVSNGREQNARLEIAKRRVLSLNGFAQETPRRMLGAFPAVAFTPGTLSLAQGGPAERRRYLDVALSMRTPAYAVRLAKYLKALAQRGALLRQSANDPAGQLDIWDEALAAEAAGIYAARMKLLEELIPLAEEFYAGISHGREKLGILYQHGRADGTREGYLAALRGARAGDILRGVTSVGPHRDDLQLTLDGRELRAYGSQGQQRTAALALKLAEAQALRAALDERPVALLDDVLSELDAARQRDLLRYLEGWQVFLTCCEPSHALHGKAGQVVRLEAGNVR